MLRSLNPMYRRDIIPGASEPSPLRLPQTEVSRFIDLQDSIYSHRSNELLNKRTEVEVNDDTPTYYHKSKRYAKRGKSRATRLRSKATKRRAASKKKSASSRKRSRRRR